MPSYYTELACDTTSLQGPSGYCTEPCQSFCSQIGLVSTSDGSCSGYRPDTPLQQRRPTPPMGNQLTCMCDCYSESNTNRMNRIGNSEFRFGRRRLDVQTGTPGFNRNRSFKKGGPVKNRSFGGRTQNNPKGRPKR